MVARFSRILTVSFCLAIVPLAACGVRSPLGDVAAGLEPAPLDASGDGGGVSTPAAKSAVSGARGDAAVAPTCAQRLAACESDSACVPILNCVLLDCAAASASTQMTCAFG